MRLHAANKEVTPCNYKVMQVRNLITLVEAKNTHGGKSIKEDNFSSLTSKLYLCLCTKVL